MFITVEELQEHPVTFDDWFAPEHIDYLTEGLRQISPLKVQGSARLVADEIDIQGRVTTSMEVFCARCLEPVEHPVDVNFDLIYRPISSIRRGDEFEVPRGEEEIGFYRDDHLLLEDVVKEQVLLSLPMKSICQSDCRGLCPVCGTNLNREKCNCPQPPDPRWVKLKL
jgi:uncharacterized protein